MHTPLKKTFDNPEYLARSRKYDHKCACDICICGKHCLMKESIGVQSQDPSLKVKPPIATFTKHIRFNRGSMRRRIPLGCKPTTIPMLFRPVTRPHTHLIKFRKKSRLCKRVYMSLRKPPSKDKPNTKKAIWQIKPNQPV